MSEIVKHTLYEVESRNSPFGFKIVTVVTSRGQRAKAPRKGAKRLESFYGRTDLSRREMLDLGYVVQANIM